MPGFEQTDDYPDAVLAYHHVKYALLAHWEDAAGMSSILGAANPKFKPELSAKFSALMQSEADRINGIKR